jgi:hypothetical protein
MRINVRPFKTLLVRSELVMGHANGFWLLNWVCIMSPPNLCPGFWQLIRSCSVSTSAWSFVRSPPMIQLFPRLSLVMRAGFMAMTLRQSNIPMEKSKLTETKIGETGEKQSQEHAHQFLCPHVHKEFILVCQTLDRLCGLVVRLPGCRPRGPRFDYRRCQIFWLAVGLERGPLSPCEDKWGATWKKSTGSGLEIWD